MKHKRINYVMYALLALSLILLTYSGLSIFSIAQGTKEEQHAYKTIMTGSTDAGDVAIELTPLGIKDGFLSVQLSANTHAVDLSQFDLTKITVLEVNGQKIAPSSAPALQGHHASGTLDFKGVPAGPFSIAIIGIPQVEARRYTWP